MGGLGAVSFIDAVALPEAGPYTVLVNPDTMATGSLTSTLYTVPADLSGPIAPGGPAVPVALAVGQNASYTFTGSIGQRVSLAATGSVSGHLGFGCDATVTIRRPNGSAVTGGSVCVESGGFLEPVTLPDDGPYTVAVDPLTAASGSVTLSLHTVPADVTGSLTVNGSTVPVSLTTPGQNAVLSFSGTGGQAVTVRVTGNSIASVNVRLLSGTTTLKQATSSAAAFNLAPHTLPSTGTYTVKVDPPYANTGGLSVQVTNP